MKIGNKKRGIFSFSSTEKKTNVSRVVIIYGNCYKSNIELIRFLKGTILPKLCSRCWYRFALQQRREPSNIQIKNEYQ